MKKVYWPNPEEMDGTNRRTDSQIEQLITWSEGEVRGLKGHRGGRTVSFRVLS